MPPHPPGLKGPRALVVMELKRSGAVTAKELAARLGVSLNAVRHHLKELEVAGLVTYHRAHRGVGAPAFMYRLSAGGEGLFPRRYEEAVTRLLDHVVAREGRAAAVEVLESRYRELTARLRTALGDAPPEERMAVVARMLADEGYMPEVRDHHEPGLRLVEHNCPIQQVAERFPEVCEAEARFLAEVLRAQVTRDAHIASGCGTCEYQISHDPRLTTHDSRLQMTDSVETLVGREYKYGFVTDIESDAVPPGLDEDVIRLISAKKGEPAWLLDWRLRAFRAWRKMEEPHHWANIRYPPVDYQSIVYYSAPRTPKPLGSLDELDPKLRETYEKLGIPLSEQKLLAGVAVDAIFDSVSVGTTYKKQLGDLGIVFCSFSEAVREHPELVRKYLGSVVPITDNFFASLNAAVFTDGSFVYVPPGVHCPVDLSTYFRINQAGTGQFERTLIVADEGATVSYLEGCTAPRRDENQLHAAVVELVALPGSTIRYSTVQNWYAGDEAGVGGIYNFVTKRGKALDGAKISWTQVETGSAITWKYPSVILQGDDAVGEFYSVAVVNNAQQADTGTKMIHLGRNTRSTIVSKGISAGRGNNSYRGLVKVLPKAANARNYTQCDSMLIGNRCGAHTFPYIDVQNRTSRVEHEASTSKIGEDQIFYLKQRGLNTENAISMVVNGFCKEVFKELPMEFAVEAQKLLGVSLEGSVG